MITRKGIHGNPRGVIGRGLGEFVAAFVIAGPLLAQPTPDWTQWGRTPQHGGAAPVVAQPLQAMVADVIYDPFVEQMKAETDGELLAHYAVPLVDDTGVYMTYKSGTYTGFGNWDSLRWNVKKFEWIAGQLVEVWTFASDWVPEPLSLTFWEPVFLGAVSGGDLYVPALGGTVFRVSRQTGAAIERLNPFGDMDPSRYVAGGLAVGPDGSVVYDVVGLNAGDPFGAITGAWLVRLAPDGTTSRVSFSSLVRSAPGSGDACQSTFSSADRPWPPSPSSTPPTTPCGAQRPGINVVPAIAPDGTIYSLSVAHLADRYAYLVAAGPDLSPRWAASLRGILNDGCGVLLEDDDTNRGCRSGANLGVDPATNDQPAGRVSDQGTQSPVVLPDGSIVVGAYTGYNFGRGHLFKFDSDGSALATYDFGWDVTPAVRVHDATYSILSKDNHYSSPDGHSYYDVTSLDANLVPEWSYRATNTESCVRQPDDSVTCVDDQPEGFEWCVNQPAVDANGTVFLNSEDGTLYGFDTNGAVVGRLFLDTSLGAAYTPIAIGPDGIVYTQNNGHLYAVGETRHSRTPAVTVATAPPGPRAVARR
jgi:Domain of unknown function (DUF5122) beta-propeller